MIVLSTGLNAPTRHLCEASVRAQTLKAGHIYIDAANQDPPLTRVQNLLGTLDGIDDPDEIVCLLDGDDWLAVPDALAKVQAAHDAGAWVTYGSFATSDDQQGYCAPYISDEYRREPWKASHLKTFRAGLFQKIRPESFLGPDGKLIEHCTDQLLLFPMLEMAGPKRVTYISDILYIYNRANSFEAARGPDVEKQVSAWLRAQKPYEVLP